jgi:MFS family permease
LIFSKFAQIRFVKYRFLTRVVVTLSVVSLFTDISSEMLYPIMPVFLTSIGFTALWIGMMEGIAEAVVGLSKGYFGKWSDVSGRRLPFVIIGYLFSSISKPLIALFTSIPAIFFLRSTDRLGKGIRTAARDAMLAHESDDEHRGKVFGFHRAMDTFGAAIGPLLALIYLHYNPGEYKQLFMYAFIPAIAGVSLLFFLKERKEEGAPDKNNSMPKLFSFLGYWKKSSPAYKHASKGLIGFALINSSDAFLLLGAKHAGANDEQVILAYIFYNLVYALLAFPAGVLADRIGMKKTFMLGMVFFSAAYTGMAFAKSAYHIYALFAVYGFYAAIVETVSRAWLSRLSEKTERATALGFYSGMTSLALMAASTIAGAIWVAAGAGTIFLFSASGAAIVLFYFAITKPKEKNGPLPPV